MCEIAQPENRPLIENDLLEMSNQMKQIVDKHENDAKRFKVKYIELKKTIAHIYGLVRQTYEMPDPQDEGVLISYFVHAIRSICSDVLFTDEEAELGLFDD